ncbi:hypothetical protein PIB30_088261 [Stylosanthes scabra]|uniref:RNase H type-1 domain-containing protein n=1 Tax=Stylosanthes scabra TaxID=79078 RepID=A0ABU6YSH2_9FABA|nr:hypothetical protein [Stylosanthes scabra]
MAIEAEISAILQGVEVAWERNLKKIIVESDSRSAIELIANPPQNHPLFTRMLRRIKNLINKEWKKLEILEDSGGIVVTRRVEVLVDSDGEVGYGSVRE